MIKTVLFDVDGVFLSEEMCFDASALTVWELLYSPAYLGLAGDHFTAAPDDAAVRRIRKTVFADDAVLNFVKTRGINSNWDMVFMTFSHQLLRLLRRLQSARSQLPSDVLNRPLGQQALQAIGRAAKESDIDFTPDFETFVRDFSETQAEKQALLSYVSELAAHWLDVSTDLFTRNSPLWELGQAVYQEWYLGDAYYEQSEGKPPQTTGKSGFLEEEVALADPEQIRDLLRDLREKGLTLGIGTGRPHLECEVPFKALGFWEYFDPERIVTATDVIEAEKAYPDHAPLGKPQPFTYVKGLCGRSEALKTVLKTPLPVASGGEVLIVGDSVADYMAAQSMGCRFAATLTGLSGKAERQTFEALQADYICEDVLGLRDILL